MLSPYFPSSRIKSMFPVFHLNDIVQIRDIEGMGISVGDVNLFRSDAGKKIIHRVINIVEEGFCTQGDIF